jgi:hypothetical protein
MYPLKKLIHDKTRETRIPPRLEIESDAIDRPTGMLDTDQSKSMQGITPEIK